MRVETADAFLPDNDDDVVIAMVVLVEVVGRDFLDEYSKFEIRFDLDDSIFRVQINVIFDSIQTLGKAIPLGHGNDINQLL